MAEEIRAETVASVYQVRVRDGHPVRPSVPVVILESMKTEIPVHPETSGHVVVKVAAGDVVQEGALIAVVE